MLPYGPFPVKTPFAVGMGRTPRKRGPRAPETPSRLFYAVSVKLDDRREGGTYTLLLRY
jgi:hypothetical protein